MDASIRSREISPEISGSRKAPGSLGDLPIIASSFPARAHARIIARSQRGRPMELARIETSGLRCPQPVLMLASRVTNVSAGTLVEIRGDCPSFEKDIRTWAERSNRTILAVMGMPPRLVIQIRV